MDSPDRIEELFNKIQAGEHPLDAAEELERNDLLSQHPTEAQMRGEASELGVQMAISSLEGVSEVVRMEVNKSADTGGKDLVVHFNSASPFYELFSVGVQVKSSPEKIREFKQTLSRNVQGLRRKDVDQWMLQNKLIVLVGTEPPEEIVEDFTRKTQEVYDFHFPPER